MAIWIGGGVGMNFGSPFIGGGWGNEFGGCCNRMLGPNRGLLTGALTGGLIGAVLGGGNPLTGLLGATIGGAIGQNWGRHNQGQFCNPYGGYNNGCSSFPPAYGNCFGGPQFGGYQMPGNYGCNYGQPMWGGQGYNNVNLNFNFGNQCPPSQCCCPCRNQCGCNGQRGLGQLSQEGKGKPISYTTSGGYKVTVNGTDVIVTDPSGKNEVKTWGDPHENLNGKHVKDWNSKQRTIVLGDGTKITMSAPAKNGVVENTSIYDGRQNVQITNKGNQITNYSFNPYDTMMREMSQYDGETAVFRTGRNGVATYDNIYNQDQNFNITSLYQQIGRTGGYLNPGQVQDFYP